MPKYVVGVVLTSLCALGVGKAIYKRGRLDGYRIGRQIESERRIITIMEELNNQIKEETGA